MNKKYFKFILGAFNENSFFRKWFKLIPPMANSGGGYYIPYLAMDSFKYYALCILRENLIKDVAILELK